MKRTKVRLALLLVALLTACGCAGTAPRPPTAPTPSTPVTPPATTPATEQPTAEPTPEPPEAFTTLPNGVSVVDLDASWAFMGIGDDGLWLVAQRDRGRDVLRVDSETLAIESRLRDLPTLAEPSAGLAAKGSIWIGEYGEATVRQYDALTGEELGALEVGANPYFPTLAFDDVWVPLHKAGALAHIDPGTATFATVGVAPKGDAGPLLVDTGDGLIWEAAPNAPTVVAVDPTTNEVVRSFALADTCRPGVSWLRGRLFVGGCADDTLILDPTSGQEVGRTSTRVPVGHERLELGNLVWATAPSTSDDDYAVAAFDANTLQIIATFRTGTPIEDGYVASGFDALWVSSGGSGRIIRIPASALPRAAG